MTFKIYLYVFALLSFNIVTSSKSKVGIIIVSGPLTLRSPHKSLSNGADRRIKYERIDIQSYEAATEIPNVDESDIEIKNYGFQRDLDQDFFQDSENLEYNLKNKVGNKGYDVYDHYSEDKIVGGFEVDISLYPYHVAYGSNCGGAIIHKDWVITAGHCGKKPYIRAGSKYLYRGNKIFVKDYFVHPTWSASNKAHPFDYDFQLLYLSESLKFDDNIQPVKIANIEDMVIGKVVTVTGWGNTVENGPYSNVLRAVRVPIVSKENCQKVPYPYFRGSLTPRMFCAGYKEGQKDACQGDSGGPAVANGRLLGMVSFGYGCATPGSYGVYSKVAKVRSWIERTARITLD